jgi:sulfide:quinone oxidoreductase
MHSPNDRSRILAPINPREGSTVRVAIVGGGFAAAEAVIALRTLAGDRVTIDVVAANAELALRPLAAAAPFGMEELRGVPLSELCADHHATLHVGAVTLVDVAGRRLETDRRETISYDVAIIATGGRTRTTIEGALLFDGLRGITELRRLVGQAAKGPVGRIVFAIPDGVTWALPAYELALMTALRTADHAQVTVVTPEQAPLELFGPAAGARLSTLLAERAIELVTDSVPSRIVPAGLLTSRGVVQAHRVVALPRVEGPRIPGLPADRDGFVPVDEHCLVDGTATVYAAGDVIAFPVKQGGLAAQQADTAAAAIAARVGAPVEPVPFAPVLRAMLLTGSIPLFLRAAGPADAAASDAPLWLPAGKVAARYLSPWLADRVHARSGTAATYDRAAHEAAGPVDPQAAVDLALSLADDEAETGDDQRALQWLEAAETLTGVLPPEYVERRRRWSEGAPKLVRAPGES